MGDLLFAGSEQQPQRPVDHSTRGLGGGGGGA